MNDEDEDVCCNFKCNVGCNTTVQRDTRHCPDMRMFKYVGTTQWGSIFSGDSREMSRGQPRPDLACWRPANNHTNTGGVCRPRLATSLNIFFRKSGKFEVYCKERLSVETVNIEKPQCKSFFVISNVKRRRCRALKACSKCGKWVVGVVWAAHAPSNQSILSFKYHFPWKAEIIRSVMEFELWVLTNVKSRSESLL